MPPSVADEALRTMLVHRSPFCSTTEGAPYTSTHVIQGECWNKPFDGNCMSRRGYMCRDRSEHVLGLAGGRLGGIVRDMTSGEARATALAVQGLGLWACCFGRDH
jgi:hypothetical protein